MGDPPERNAGLTVTAIIGGQYGSEGKGVIAHHLANKEPFQAYVRVGGPNAGHTIHTPWGRFAMQSVPVGWDDGQNTAALVLGRGAVISPEVLQREIDEIRTRTGMDITKRLHIDLDANILDERHHNEEGGVDGVLHHRIGSTGEGVGAVRSALLARNPGLLRKAREEPRWNTYHDDTVTYLHGLRVFGGRVMLEGTQGTGLSLVHGPWPYVTTCDPTVSGMSADAGLPMPEERVVVFRAFPIRVAGNSGPLLAETDWGTLGVPEERTTVTKKVRRVGRWDWSLFTNAIVLNRPTALVLTFGDYLDPECIGTTKVGPNTRRLVHTMQERSQVPVRWVTNGPADSTGKIVVIDL